ncbi:hypothetical protein EUU23_12535 [Sphingorhabdus sp. IMCC26285]|uniref:Uncharacterized protein n=1 Tax=Sphingorhabdus profundilacus TaxID=2509718 RepID=A0A6I4LZS0_9SPHN|nr:hypothetical protein [Sphingorhabdus profundilacus]MVZ98521.1 hypothetical protein [Sphingorhabdus profundilacus]
MELLYLGIFIVAVIILPVTVALIVPKRILGLFVFSILISSPILTGLTWQHFASQPDYGGGGNGLAAFIFSFFVIAALSVSFTVGVIRYVINRDKVATEAQELQEYNAD